MAIEYIIGTLALMAMAGKKKTSTVSAATKALLSGAQPKISGFISTRKPTGRVPSFKLTNTGKGRLDEVARTDVPDRLTGESDLARAIRIYGVPHRQLVIQAKNGAKTLTTFEEMEKLRTYIESRRKVIDDASSSSSYEDMTGARIWQKGDFLAFIEWWATMDGQNKHAKAEQDYAKTGGNHSAWGAGGVFSDALEWGGNIIGTFFGAPGAGTAISGVYDGVTTAAKTGDWGNFASNVAGSAADALGVSNTVKDTAKDGANYLLKKF